LRQLAGRNSLTDMHGLAARWRPDKRFTQKGTP
jgi:hypothetical protein